MDEVMKELVAMPEPTASGHFWPKVATSGNWNCGRRPNVALIGWAA